MKNKKDPTEELIDKIPGSFSVPATLIIVCAGAFYSAIRLIFGTRDE